MLLVQSVAANVPILMVDSADHVTGKTGLTLTIRVSKAGGAWESITPTVTEIGFGAYTVALTAEHVDTLGVLALHVTAAGADPYDSFDQVVPAASASLTLGSGTIATLALLKNTVGIALEDASQDDILTQKLLYAIAYVEGETHRYFGAPTARVEYRDGHARRKMFLGGHIDDTTAADSSGEGDPTTSLRVFRRAKQFGSSGWEELIENEDWERRGDFILFLRLWWVWPCEDEFRLEYLDGYENAPADIQQLIVEIAAGQFLSDSDNVSGAAGVISEKLGDFSYTRDSAIQSSSSATLSLSDGALRTINRYARKLV